MKPNPLNRRRTHQELSHDIKLGMITAKTAIYYAANDLGKHLTSLEFLYFSKWLKTTLPLVDWDDPATVYTGTGLYWNCLDDVLEYVDKCTGGLLELASWFKKHINEPEDQFSASAESKAQDISAKQQEIEERVTKAKELREQGMTQQAIAGQLGVSRETVSKDLVKNPVRTEKNTKPPRKVIRYEISQYTRPETAAIKIRQIFGDEFADQLIHQLTTTRQQQ